MIDRVPSARVGARVDQLNGQPTPMRCAIAASLIAIASATACHDRAAPSTAGREPNLSVSIIPRLTSEEVAQIAKRLAISKDVELDKYAEPRVAVDTSGGKVTWTAAFQMKSSATPGSNFTVIVDDSTKNVTYIAGE